MLLLARLLPASAYGALSVWTAAALFLATTFFDWVRFSALRFYTPRVRVDDPATRASLDTAFALAIVPALLAVGIAWAADLLPGLTASSAVALLALAVGNAASEYLSALARCRFDSGAYARLVIFRHGLTIGVVVPVAVMSGSAVLTLSALAVAIWPSVAHGIVALRDRAASLSLARRADFARFAGYGLPLIGAEALFLAMVLMNRSWLAADSGFVTAGAYALTFDLAFKVLAVLASVCEASLFPLLVARREEGGLAASREAVTRNIALTLLLLTPAAIGYWRLAEPFAALVIAPDLRPAFVASTGAALVGAILYILQTYVYKPAFQLELQTMPLLRAAALAFAVNAAVLLLGSAKGLDAVIWGHIAGLGAGFALMTAQCLAQRRLRWPVRDSLKIAAASAAMLAAGRWGLPVTGSAVLDLAAGTVIMGAVVAALAFALDIAGLRTLLLRRWARRPA
jgi:O-antigen/teichoic acid export membrane protein